MFFEKKIIEMTFIPSTFQDQSSELHLRISKSMTSDRIKILESLKSKNYSE